MKYIVQCTRCISCALSYLADQDNFLTLHCHSGHNVNQDTANQDIADQDNLLIRTMYIQDIVESDLLGHGLHTDIFQNLGGHKSW